MSSASKTGISAASARPSDEEQVFTALANVARSKLVVALAKGGPQMASDLANAGNASAVGFRGKILKTPTARNLKVLEDAGIAVEAGLGRGSS